MGDVEIDLQILEEMCAEIEESAVLVDKEMHILWLNPVLKQALSFEIRDVFSDSAKITQGMNELYGDIFTEKVRAIFSTGRLLKATHNHKGKIKITALPVKMGSEVLYILLLIEHIVYGASSDSIVSSLLNHIKSPCFLVSNDSLVSFNSAMSKIFRDAPALLDYIRHSAPSYEKNFNNIKKLFRYSYNITRSPLKEGEKVSAHLYVLEQVDKKRGKTLIRKKSIKKKSSR